MFIYIYILRWEVLTHKTSLTPQFVLIEESAATQENVRSCICVLRRSCICVLGAVMYLCFKAVMYLCIRGIKFASFYEFDKILELLRQCGIFVFFSFSFYSY